MAAPIIGGAALGLGALGSLFGGREPPSAAELARLFGPGALANETQQLFRLLASSPAFRAQLTGIGVQGSGLSRNLTANLARRGLTTTGVGSIASALGQSAAGFAQQQARGALFTQANQAALQNLLARLQAFSSLQGQSLGQPTGFERFSGALAGASPFLFMQGQRTPGAFTPFGVQAGNRFFQ